MKKLSLLIVLLLTLTLVNALNLEVTPEPISNTIVKDLDKPAIFNLKIKNLEENSETIEIYSVIGLEITPEKKYTIGKNATANIKVEVKIPEILKTSTGSHSFEYKLRNFQGEIQEEEFPLKIIEKKDLIQITPENINPSSEYLNTIIKNTASFNVSAKLSSISAFSEYETDLFLEPYETIELKIPLNNEDKNKLTAGNYLINFQIKIDNIEIKKETMIRFLEQEGIDFQKTSEGFLIQRKELIKKNVGNIKKSTEIKIEKNIISFLFTTLNTEPDEIYLNGLKITYLWKKELIPNEELKIIAKTNWFYPLIIIILIILIIYFIKKSVETDLILTKNVSFVKTKGGEFALKVTLRAKSKRYLEKINIIDKIPVLVKLYEKFGAITPDKIDLENRRLEWNMESLNKDEERVFTYIIYSKIGVVGRFELPEAKATYEKEGKIKQATSNRSFYINEPRDS